MRDKFNKIVMAIGVLVAVSCSGVYDFGECMPLSEPRNVNFVLAIDSPDATRAEWGDAEPTDEIGTSFENRILPESLRVAIFATDNTHLGDVEELLYWPINDAATRYQFSGKLPQSVTDNLASETNYKVMVYANCAEGDNDALNYAFADVDMTAGAIPMWGVKAVDLSGLLDNQSQNVGEISLLRAVAKIEVVVDDALSGCTLEDVTLNHYNRSGYVLPMGWGSAQDTKRIDRAGGFRERRSVAAESCALREVETDRKFVIYVPEYDNALFAEYEAKLSVTVNYGGTPMSFADALQFKSYSGGRPTGEVNNITRNTIYRFRITKVASGGLELNYEVADWQRSDNWEWVQHFDYPNYHNPVLPDSAPRDGTASNDLYPERPEMRYTSPNSSERIENETGAFSCWFQLISPIDQRWLPTLRTASNLCVIRVYKEIDAVTYELVYTTENSDDYASELKDGSKLVAFSGWYNIKVIPIDPTYTGVARFGITYTQDWMGAGSRYLLINGEDEHTIWPNSGSEVRIIDIQQVSN
jgi:hypothetical protein